MPKWVKCFVAVLLLPVCLGAIKALWLVLHHAGGASTTWVALGGGAACWVVIYLMLPKPMWVYVLGHEFTHAIWAWLFNGKVKSMKVSSKGGHVVVTKSNFLIALAPYFFPVYAVLVVAVFVVGHLIWNWTAYMLWFHLLLGAAYAFHLTLTWHILKTEQSDITQHGWFFSGVVIFLGNIAVLLMGVPLVTGHGGVGLAMSWWLQGTGDVLRRIGSWLHG